MSATNYAVGLAGVAALTGGILGPLAAAANQFPIGMPTGNLGNVGSLAMAVTETALSSIPTTLCNN